MDRLFTKTFFRFFAGFLAIIILAFGVMLFASSKLNTAPSPVDIVAQPK